MSRKPWRRVRSTWRPSAQASATAPPTSMERTAASAKARAFGSPLTRSRKKGHEHEPAEAEDQPAEDVADGAEQASRPGAVAGGATGRSARVRRRRMSACSAS